MTCCLWGNQISQNFLLFFKREREGDFLFFLKGQRSYMPLHRWDTLRRRFTPSLVHEWDLHKYDALNRWGLDEKRRRAGSSQLLSAKYHFLILFLKQAAGFSHFSWTLLPLPPSLPCLSAGSSQEVHFSIRESHKCVNGGRKLFAKTRQ